MRNKNNNEILNDTESFADHTNTPINIVHKKKAW